MNTVCKWRPCPACEFSTSWSDGVTSNGEICYVCGGAGGAEILTDELPAAVRYEVHVAGVFACRFRKPGHALFFAARNAGLVTVITIERAVQYRLF